MDRAGGHRGLPVVGPARRQPRRARREDRPHRGRPEERLRLRDHRPHRLRHQGALGLARRRPGRLPARPGAAAGPGLARPADRARPAGLRPGGRRRQGGPRAAGGGRARDVHRLDDHRDQEAAGRTGRADPGPGRLHRGDRRNGWYRWGRQEADGDPVHARRRWWRGRPHSRPLDPAAHRRWWRLPGRHRRPAAAVAAADPGRSPTRGRRSPTRRRCSTARWTAAPTPGGGAAAAWDRFRARPGRWHEPGRSAPAAPLPGWAGCSPVAAPRR